MNPLEFKRKWARFKGKESQAYVEHFNDLCRMLGHPTPAEADPTGEESFCFQKRVVKDLELFVVAESGAEYNAGEERGFADVWKKGCFAWEYKGKKKNLDEAYKQLLRYRESLLNPPLLMVCDFERYILRTNFNGTVQHTEEWTNEEIDQPRVQRLLRAVFNDPDFLKPQRTTNRVTEELAEEIARVAQSLNERESVEYEDARTRKEFRVAQAKNLRVARFLNRITFCFFAEDVGLLPQGTFTDVAKAGLENPRFFAERLEELFRVMAKGGAFGAKKIRHFNGHLFEDTTVFELTDEELSSLAQASEADWQFIEPSIFGTLFERALDEQQRSQRGAHYTHPDDIKLLVEPVLMSPLRKEWRELKRTLLGDFTTGKGSPATRKKLDSFLKKLRNITVLDPACGSGNFLYISLQLLLSMEKEVISFASQLNLNFKPGVSVQQLKAIEINPYAYELAQVSVQIGWLQWLRDNGFALDREPVLETLDGFENADALLREVFKRKPKKLKDAQKAEHTEDTSAKGHVEKEWPDCDVIVSNPPFLGDKLMRRELGDEYANELRSVYEGRLPGQSDLCCYWFEKARAQIEVNKCHRAGLLATQGIRGGAHREVLKRIKETGDIFWAESDRPWILAGANVHVSMVGFDDGSEVEHLLDGRTTQQINSNLSSNAEVSLARTLGQNAGISFMGITPSGPFQIADQIAKDILHKPNPNGKPTSDVLLPWMNGSDITGRTSLDWIIDMSNQPSELEASQYEAAFKFLATAVASARKSYKTGGKHFWKFERARPEMKLALHRSNRYIARSMVGKHQCYLWLDGVVLPANLVIVFARDNFQFFGVLHSHLHEVWALKQGTRLETRPRYTPTTCFETFPFPEPSRNAEAIAAAAREMNELRERWLNPPEWTKTEILEFPGTVGGPWSRYIAPSSIQSPASSIGLVRYPRLVPKDEECAKKLKDRTLTKLYNERPAWLDLAHRKLDEAVAQAYGWPPDLSDEKILERLLALNQERSAAEQKSGRKSPKAQRAKAEDELI
jgi:hypothetical protein